MKRVIFLWFTWVFILTNTAWAMSWRNVYGDITEAESILTGRDNIILIGTKGGVFKSYNSGKDFKRVLSFLNKKKAIRILVSDMWNKDVIYAGCRDALYCSFDSGEKWHKIFHVKGISKITAIVLAYESIIVGTESGIYKINKDGLVFNKAESALGGISVFSLAGSKKKSQVIYASTNKGVFKSDDAGANWHKLPVEWLEDKFEEKEEDENHAEEQEEKEAESVIAVHPLDENQVYFCSGVNIFKSDDAGINWRLIHEENSLSEDVRFLMVSRESEIYTITKSGIFCLKDGSWQELSLRLAAGEINSIMLDEKNNLYAATGKGVFCLDKDVFDGDRRAKDYSNGEPGIREVQRAAINYAEVNNDKIYKWRKRASQKAWLPQLNISLDRDTGDLWHWETGSSTKSLDDVLMRGKDSLEWGVRFSWDLGEIIWNNEQTSIDVRSRLMVELRNDILDEVTKLYFERLRVKMEIDNLSILDKKKRADKQLRLDELTAYLDALTGGYFSCQKEKNFN